jgi:uncharacterized membrane protein
MPGLPNSSAVPEKMENVKKNNSQQTGVQLRIWDWLVFIVLGTACFLLFEQEDLAITANNSLLILNGHFLDFYSSAKQLTGGANANYLPSTFWIFAIWEIPLALFGHTPTAHYSFTVVEMVWLKLLPTAVYICCGFLIKRIAQENLGFSVAKATLAMYLFLTAPLAFFSQLIFGQYDIFTVALMLLGLRQYLKQDESRKHFYLFVLFFALAATMKYYVLAVFFILLVLKEKRFFALLCCALLVLVPAAAEAGLYYLVDGAAFRESVLGFGAIDYAAKSEIAVSDVSIKLLPLALILLFCWAYFVRPKDRREFVCYSFYLCCGVFCILFALMRWHPQWLIIATPFWVISILLLKRPNLSLCLDTLFMLPFYIYSVRVFPNNVDQDMLTGMALMPLFGGRTVNGSLTMADIYNIPQLSTLFTLMVACLILWFVLKHPRFCLDDITEEPPNKEQEFTPFKTITAIRVRLAVGVLAFALPALLCLPSML